MTTWTLPHRQTSVMLVAWYGMVPTRNRSCYAVECIAEETMIEAKDALMYQLYVDDLLRVADTTEDQEDQIQQMEALLANSGFKLKFFTCLGQLLCNEGSSNGKTMKVRALAVDTDDPEQRPAYIVKTCEDEGEQLIHE